MSSNEYTLDTSPSAYHSLTQVYFLTISLISIINGLKSIT